MLELLALGIGAKALAVGTYLRASATPKQPAARPAAARGPPGGPVAGEEGAVEPRRLFEGELSLLSPLVSRIPAGSKRKAREEGEDDAGPEEAKRWRGGEETRARSEGTLQAPPATAQAGLKRSRSLLDELWEGCAPAKVRRRLAADTARPSLRPVRGCAEQPPGSPLAHLAAHTRFLFAPGARGGPPQGAGRPQMTRRGGTAPVRARSRPLPSLRPQSSPEQDDLPELRPLSYDTLPPPPPPPPPAVLLSLPPLASIPEAQPSLLALPPVSAGFSAGGEQPGSARGGSSSVARSRSFGRKGSKGGGGGSDSLLGAALSELHETDAGEGEAAAERPPSESAAPVAAAATAAAPFTFGGAAAPVAPALPAPPVAAAAAAAAPFTFGSAPAPSPAGAPASAFTFGAPAAAAAAAPPDASDHAAAPFTFGATLSAPAPAPAPPSALAPLSFGAPPGAAPSLGAAPSASAPSVTPFTFGGAPAAVPVSGAAAGAAGAVFSFGAPPSAAVAAPSAAPAATSPAAAFSFGASPSVSASIASPAPAPFAFGGGGLAALSAAAAASPPPSVGFTFGAAPARGGSAPFAFGAAPPVAVSALPGGFGGFGGTAQPPSRVSSPAFGAPPPHSFAAQQPSGQALAQSPSMGGFSAGAAAAPQPRKVFKARRSGSLPAKR
jgi:hypothetical protein